MRILRITFAILSVLATISAASCDPDDPAGGNEGDGDGESGGPVGDGDGDGDTGGTPGDGDGDGDTGGTPGNGDGDGDGDTGNGDRCADGGLGAEPPQSQSSGVIERLAVLSCDVLRSCCRESCFADSALENCEETQVERRQEMSDALSAGIITVNAAALDLCLARIRAEFSCEDFLADTTAFFPPEFDECQDVFSGPGEGDDCENTVECVSLGADYECLLGKCRVIPYQDLNEPCFRTTSKGFTGRGGTYWSSPDSYEVGAGQCLISDGLYCRDGTCVSTLAEGANCSDDFEGCATNLYCRDDVCSPYLPTGSSCGEEDRCLEGLCLDGECTRLRATREVCEGP